MFCVISVSREGVRGRVILLSSLLFHCTSKAQQLRDIQILCSLYWIPLSLKMPKKKKTQQKPIHRGFAVTSIPKKAPPERRDDSDAKVESASADVSHTTQTHEPVKGETLSPEEQSLQDLVDRLQERTEKEIVRTIKVRGCTREMSQWAWLIRRPTQAIETERRFSNTLPLLDLDGGIVSEILEMARGSWSTKCMSAVVPGYSS